MQSKVTDRENEQEQRKAGEGSFALDPALKPGILQFAN